MDKFNDILYIRFPEQEKQLKTGSFFRSDPYVPYEGLLFTTYEGDQAYTFEEHEIEKIELHFSKDIIPVFTPREYYLQAHQLLNGINLMQLGKAVFSRVKQVAFDTSKCIDLFHQLCEDYPKACVYLISSEIFGTWIGASPELLLESHRDHLFTMSLAGTKATADQAFEWGEKEKIEQDLVTQFIEKQLIHSEVSNIEITKPYEVQAGPVSHLRSDISADLNGKNAWEIAMNLHPTPAVSGLPRDEAMRLISNVEYHKRELYAGIFGYTSPDKTKVYVNLRCAQFQENKAYLYLGGGFTPQSIPENEWMETENKSKTLLNVMQKLTR
jgi:isochorismate synthase